MAEHRRVMPETALPPEFGKEWCIRITLLTSGRVFFLAQKLVEADRGAGTEM